MTTPRFLMGAGRGGYGLWLSKPGFDVRSCTEADLLFSSEAVDQNLLHITHGIVFLGIGASTTIFFPACDRRPVVRSHHMPAANASYQRGMEYIGSGNDAAVQATLSSLRIDNIFGYAIKVRYVVFAKPQIE